MRRWKLGAALLLTALLVSCGGANTAPVGITIAPTVTTVVLGVGTAQFTGTVTGTSNTTVNWSVAPGNAPTMGVTGGNSTLGTVSTTGLYAAPASLPSPPHVFVIATAAADTKVAAAATVNIDSGVRVQVSPASATIGTGETFQFTAQVTGATTNTAVAWTVTCAAGSGSTCGTISPIGAYTAPTTAPSPDTVTVAATSGQDPSKSGSATATVLTAATPTLTALDPSAAAQGSVFQDVYLSGTNFFSTSTVEVNGAAVPTTFINTTFLRARICGAVNPAIGCASPQLASAGSQSVTVAPQKGTASNALPLAVTAVRPALIAALPNSTPQQTTPNGPITVSLDGGFYSSATSAQFNGQPLLPTVTNPRQLNAGIAASNLTSAGLFPLEVQNAGATGVAAVNLAVEPSPAGIPTAPVATVGVGTQPVAVAINTANDTAVVVNKGDKTISRIDLTTNSPLGSAIGVGTAPTSVGVDNLLNEAVVVNSGDNTLSIVDVSTGAITATVGLPSGTTPFGVGVNPLTHRALVANSSTNVVTVVDLSTTPPTVLPQLGGTNNPISTGATPAIAIEPRLNWGIITPGGSGAVSIVDLGRPPMGDAGRAPKLVATFNDTTSVQGVAINTETEQALLTDPNSSSLTLFSLLDQTPSPLGSFVLTTGQVAAAVNSLTNIGVTVNGVANTATIVDLRTQLPVLPSPGTIAVGTMPAAVAIDAASNEAVVVNEGSNNVSILSLGAIRSLHLTQSSPANTLASSSPLTLTVIGNGFSSGSVVRLDQIGPPAVTTTFVSSRELVAMVPGGMLGLPRRYTVDVLNPDTTVSNETDLTVMQAVPVGMSPVAVALDTDRGLAVVTNSADGTVSVVDLATGTVAPITVGTSPQGVAALPRLGLAIVTNNGSNSASIIDLVNKRAAFPPVPTGSAPLGVAIQPDTAEAVVANTGSNNVTTINLATGQEVANVPMDQFPLAVAIDPIDNLAAVANATQKTVVLINLATNGLACPLCRFNFQLPTGVAFDPVTDMFIVADSVENGLEVIDPLKQTVKFPRVGINPVSLDYNFQTGTVVTVNNASNTLSVMDFQTQQVRAILPVAGSANFSVAIDPQSNLAVVVDQANNRVLLVPLPR